MSIRITMTPRRGLAAVAVMGSLVLGMAGCGGDGSSASPTAPSVQATPASGSAPRTQQESSAAPMAEIKGEGALVLSVTSAQRDTGGFLTVRGDLRNDGGSPAVVSAQLSGDETEIVKHGPSLGGATLVDAKGKKRYYVLRDTEGRPLATSGLSTLDPGASAPVFMQFPAPPADTTEVTLQLPQFDTATLTISG